VNVKDTARFKTEAKKTFEVNNLESIQIDHLSCRPRTATNVGID